MPSRPLPPPAGVSFFRLTPSASLVVALSSPSLRRLPPPSQVSLRSHLGGTLKDLFAIEGAPSQSSKAAPCVKSIGPRKIAAGASRTEGSGSWGGWNRKEISQRGLRECAFTGEKMAIFRGSCTKEKQRAQRAVRRAAPPHGAARRRRRPE